MLIDICGFSATNSTVRKCVLQGLNIQRTQIFAKEKTVLEELNRIPRVGAAGYDSGRPNAPVRCLEDTRTAVLEKIWCWIGPTTPDAATESTSDTTDKPTISNTAIDPISGTPVNPSSDAAVEPIYWVNGLAGIGKSTIARTVAEDAKRCELLGASFFFSRQEKKLSDPHLFIRTIAYQLSRSYPEARPVIINVFRHDPDIVEKSFSIQFTKLILEPLSKITSKRVVIVVDALDECDNSKGAANELFRVSGPLSLERLVLFSTRTLTNLLLALIFTSTCV